MTVTPNAFTGNVQRSNKDVGSRRPVISDVLQVDGVLNELVPLTVSAVVLLDGDDDSTMEAYQRRLTEITVGGRAV